MKKSCKNMKRKISVFIASPSDLVKERLAFKDTIKQLNMGYGDIANIEFEPLGWEDTLASTGRRSQGVINAEIDKCDVFILAMYRRWGQNAPDAKPYTSYTEEEFHRALNRWTTDKSPEIFVFFKRVDAASEADPGPQLKQVIDFRQSLEDTRNILYHYFDDEASFIAEVDRHLRAYSKGELPKADQQLNIVILPSALLEEVNKAKSYAEQKVKEAELAHEETKQTHLKLELMQLQTAQVAAELSREGKIEYARQKFSELITETVDIRILYLGYEFFHRTGDFDSAFHALNKWLNISGPERITLETASAYGYLGLLYQTREEFDHAEEMYLKALVINEALGSKAGMASDYGNLGLLYQTREEFDHAMEMHLKALAINEALGRTEGLANQYGNFGILYQKRGELDRAEEMFLRALVIDEALGRKENMARGYCNIGNLYQTRGELLHAEEMYLKALVINEALGSKAGVASDYGNLGALYWTRGKLDHAEEMFLKALAINEALGSKEGLARDYCNIGSLYQTRGELLHAEEMYLKALVINEALGSKAGMASDYGNLGILYLMRGKLGRAEEMFLKALAINEAVGSKEGLANQNCNIGILYQKRGELDHAEEMYLKALPLFSELKSPLAEKIRGLLKRLR